jgi:hypothetical protein
LKRTVPHHHLSPPPPNPALSNPHPQGKFDPQRLLLKDTLWVMAGYKALVEVAEPGAAGSARQEGSGNGSRLALTARLISVAGGWAGAFGGRSFGVFRPTHTYHQSVPQPLTYSRNQNNCPIAS